MAALLPDRSVLSEWPVLMEAAVESPIGERRIVVERCLHSFGAITTAFQNVLSDNGRAVPHQHS